MKQTKIPIFYSLHRAFMRTHQARLAETVKEGTNLTMKNPIKSVRSNVKYIQERGRPKPFNSSSEMEVSYV